MPRSVPVLLGACALGGAIGSLARWSLVEVWPAGAGQWPWAVLSINVLGCLLLGALLGSPWGQDPLRRVFLGAGVLGGFTTFSTYAVQVKVLTDDGHGAMAGGYAAASVVGCLLAAHVGRRWAERRDDLGPEQEQGEA